MRDIQELQTVMLNAWVDGDDNLSAVSFKNDKSCPIIVPTKYIKDAETILDIKNGINLFKNNYLKKLRDSKAGYIPDLLFGIYMFSNEYLYHYINCSWRFYDGNDSCYIEDFYYIVSSIKSGNYTNILMDNMDGYCYDIGGNRVLKKYWFNYSDVVKALKFHNISNETFIYKKLNHDSRVEDLRMTDIPYYDHLCREYKRVPTFVFVPSQEDFDRISTRIIRGINSECENSCIEKDEIIKILGIFEQ